MRQFDCSIPFLYIVPTQTATQHAHCRIEYYSPRGKPSLRVIFWNLSWFQPGPQLKVVQSRSLKTQNELVELEQSQFFDVNSTSVSSPTLNQICPWRQPNYSSKYLLYESFFCVKSTSVSSPTLNQLCPWNQQNYSSRYLLYDSFVQP